MLLDIQAGAEIRVNKAVHGLTKETDLNNVVGTIMTNQQPGTFHWNNSSYMIEHVVNRAANKYFFLEFFSDQFTILVGLNLNLVGHKTIITTISGT